MRGRVGSAFVQAHDNICPQRFLDLDGFLRRNHMSGPVEMGLKLDPFFGNSNQGIKAEDLESPTIGKQGMVPVHELVQPSEPADPLMPGPQVEMVGIGKDHFRPHLLKFFRGQGFHCSLGPHGNKNRGVEDTMGSSASSHTLMHPVYRCGGTLTLAGTRISSCTISTMPIQMMSGK